jgi:hypothetical protein
MATETERARLRRDTGTDDVSLDDTAADDIFTEAGEVYTDATSAGAYARVLVINGLIAQAAKVTTYKQNETTENRSDLFKHLQALLDLWQKRLDDAVADADVASLGGGVRFGRVHRKPAKIREYPGGI